VQHPDERVLDALIRSPARYALKPKTRLWLDAAITARALHDAQREGALWTPVLDSLEPGTIATLEWSSHFDKVLTPRDIKPDRNTDKLSRRRTSWLVAQTDSAPLLELLSHFRSRQIHSEVAQYASALSPALLRRLRRGDLSSKLFSNPHLPAEEREKIRQAAIRALAGMPTGISPLSAESIVERVQRSKNPLSPEERAFLLPFSTRNADIYRLILMSPSLETAELAFILTHADRPSIIRHVIKHPAATKEVLRLAAKNRDARKRLADDPDALQDPELRSILAKQGSAKILYSLLRHVPDEEYPTLFSRLAKKNVVLALRHLESTDARRSLIPNESLVPFLKHPDANNRLRAITVLSHSCDVGPDSISSPRRSR